MPVYQTVGVRVSTTPSTAADLFNLAVPGNIYTRIMNPTQAVLEQRVAELERGVGALALSAGSAAVNYSILNLAEAGDNIVSVPATLRRHLYACSRTCLPKQGIEVRFAESDSPAEPRQADRRQDQGRVLREHRQSRRQTSSTWRRWPTWRIAHGVCDGGGQYRSQRRRC